MRVISQNGKQTKYTILASELLKLEILFPEYQRDLLKEHSDKITEFQLLHFKKHGSFFFLNCIQICSLEGLWYCVDGQHRYNAIKDLIKTMDWFIDIEVTMCIDEDEMHEIFRTININKPLPEFFKKPKNELAIWLHIKNWILRKYPAFIKKTIKPQMPNINLDFFVDELNKKYSFTSLKEFIEWFQTENKAHRLHLENNLHHENVNIIFNKIKSKPQDFYLGCFWLTPIKNKIPTTVRIECWREWYASVPEDKKSKHGDILCYCCDLQTINANHFEAGHIISFKNGGHTHLNNLRPICSTCNKRMGTMNMDEFREINQSCMDTRNTL
jgi:5-methylcytosine-specific restriction endonuclease McrA